MRNIPASGAKAHHRRQEKVDKSVTGIMALRRYAGSITAEEILLSRDEGRKY